MSQWSKCWALPQMHDSNNTQVVRSRHCACHGLEPANKSLGENFGIKGEHARQAVCSSSSMFSTFLTAMTSFPNLQSTSWAECFSNVAEEKLVIGHAVAHLAQHGHLFATCQFLWKMWLSTGSFSQTELQSLANKWFMWQQLQQDQTDLIIVSCLGCVTMEWKQLQIGADKGSAAKLMVSEARDHLLWPGPCALSQWKIEGKSVSRWGQPQHWGHWCWHSQQTPVPSLKTTTQLIRAAKQCPNAQLLSVWICCVKRDTPIA